MNAVLSLEWYKCKIGTKRDWPQKKKFNMKEFYEENIEDIVELETNYTGTEEFENALIKGNKE